MSLGFGDRVGNAEIAIGLDVIEVKTGLDKLNAEVRATAADINRTRMEATLGVDTKKLDAELASYDARIKAVTKARDVEIKLNTKRFDAQLAELRAREKEFQAQSILDKATDPKRSGSADEAQVLNQQLRLLTEAAQIRRRAAAEELQERLRKEEGDRLLAENKRRLKLQSEQDALRAREVERRAGVERAKELSNEFSLRKRLNEEANRLYTEAHKEVKVDANIKDAQAKIILLTEELKLLGHDTTHIKFDVRDEKGRTVQAAAQDIKGQFRSAFSDLKSFAKSGPDILPGRGAIPLGAVVAAAPVVPAIAGGLGSLVSGIGSGVFGAGAIGGGLAAGGILNLGGTISALLDFRQETKLADESIQKMEQTIQRFGKNSPQAAVAIAQYNSVLKEVKPNASAFARELERMHSQFTALTEGHLSSDVLRVVEQMGKTLDVLRRPLAQNTNEFGDILAKQSELFGRHLREPEEAKGIADLGKGFNTFLGPALEGLQNLGAVLIHISESAVRLFAGPAGRGFRHWAEDLNAAYEPGTKLDEKVKHMGESAEKLFHFLGALTQAIFTFFAAGQSAGGELLEKMTERLREWTAWMKTLQGQNSLHKFFHDGNESMKDFFHALGPVVKLFWEWSKSLTPLLQGILKITSGMWEIVGAAGKIVGITPDMKGLGEAIGVAFAVSKISGFASIAKNVVKDFKELGALSALGNIFTKGRLDVNTAGIDAALKGGADYAATKFYEALVTGGRAAAGEIAAGERAGGGGIPNIPGGGAAKDVNTADKVAEDASKIGGDAAGAGVLAKVLSKVPGGGKLLDVFGKIPGLGGTAAEGVTGALAPIAITGLTAYLASRGIGKAIGGPLGNEVSSFGSSISVGATGGGIAGSFLGPEAIIPGALLGGGGAAVINLLTKLIGGPSAGEVKAKREAQELGISGSGVSALAAINQHEEEAFRHNRALRAGGRGGGVVIDKGFALSAEERQGAQSVANIARGAVAGQSFAQSILGADNGKKIFKFDELLQEAQKSLEKLSPLGKQEMLRFIKGTFGTLEGEGRLAASHAYGKFLADSKSQLAQLPSTGEEMGKNFAQRTAKALEDHRLAQALQKVTKQISEEFGSAFNLITVKGNATWSEFISDSAQNLGILREEMHSKVPYIRQAATQAYDEMEPLVKKRFETTRESIGFELDKANTLIKKKSPEGPAALLHAYHRMLEVQSGELAAGVEVTGSTMSQINEIFREAMKNFEPSAHVPKLKQTSPPKLVTQHGGGAGSAFGGGEFLSHATGGMVQYGRGGERGGDSIKTNMIVAPGEVGAVFTHQQQARVNAALMKDGVGGLQALFGQYSTPHYMSHGGMYSTHNLAEAMASGGFSGYSLPLPPSKMFPGSWSIDQGVDIPAPAGTPEFAIGPGRIIQEGISGFGPNAPVLQISSGPLQGHNIYYGHAGPDRVKVGDTVRAGEQITEVGAGIVGISTGPHIEIGFGPPFGKGGDMAAVLKALMGGAGVAGIAVGGAAVEQAIFKILEPHISGNSLVAKGVRGVVRKGIHAIDSRVAGRVGGATHGEVAGSVVTASYFGGHNDPSAFGKPTASGKIANDSLWGFAELSHPGTLDFAALGGLPMGQRIKVSYNGRTITVPKVDKGAGGPGLGGRLRAIDLTYAANAALGAPGLENVHWQKAASGLYMKPALLVGEHENEYVINPHRKDNASYLKRAAADMGYMVTPAATGKAPKANVLGTTGHPLAELPQIAKFKERAGIPLEVIDAIMHPLEQGVKTEVGLERSLLQKEDELTKRKDLYKKTGHVRKAEEAIKVSEKETSEKEAAVRAAAHSKNTTRVLEQLRIAHEHKPTETNFASAYAQARRMAAEGKNAEQIAAVASGLVEKAKKENNYLRLKRALEAQNVQNSKFLQEGKLLDTGLKAVRKGGVYQHEQYYELGNEEQDYKDRPRHSHSLYAAMFKARQIHTEVKGAQEHINDLNKRISHYGTDMNRLAERYKKTRDPKDRKAWEQDRADRSAAITELQKILTGQKQTADALLRSRNPLFNSEKTKQIKEAAEEGLDNVAASQAEAEASGETVAGGIPTALVQTSEDFIRSSGKNEELEKLNEAMALAQAKVIPDNPNTPINEELPGLREEIQPTQKLYTFWDALLKEAQNTGQPPSLITELASQYNSAKDAYYNLVQSVETASRGQSSQILSEQNAFSSARLELYRNFGSNFAPVPVLKPVTGIGKYAQGGTVEGGGTTVHVTNHFSHPPEDPHVWSHGVAWELGNAI